MLGQLEPDYKKSLSSPFDIQNVVTWVLLITLCQGTLAEYFAVSYQARSTVYFKLQAHLIL
jgi:hypothetical protein